MQKEIINDCIEWDVVNWSKALDFWVTLVDLEDKNLKCLELGARSGGISLWLALKGNYVVCSDLHKPGEKAISLHQKYSVSQKITYEAINASAIPYENYFDIVVFKSILGGIGRMENTSLMQQVINEIYKSLKPGGKVLFAENLKASIFHQFLRRKITRWGKYWSYLDLNQIEVLFSQFTVTYNTAGFLGVLGRNEAQRNFLGKIDTLIMDKVMNKQTRYIVYGVATKAIKSSTR